jgi:nitric oxide reductase large subunit
LTGCHDARLSIFRFTHNPAHMASGLRPQPSEVHAWSLSEFVLLPIRIAAVAFVTLAFHTPSHDQAVVGPQHQPP